MGKRSLSLEQGRRVLARLRERLQVIHKGNQAALARELGIAQPSLWQLLNDETKPSLATAEALAKVEGVWVESILTAPRDRAAALCREAGIPEGAIQKVLAKPLRGIPAERVVLYWVNRIQAVATLG